ncbi:MAG: hypothetical protein HFJ33_01055 [Clostridia bacterium]|nr:hypothetical protein [Clostridia bacterium]
MSLLKKIKEVFTKEYRQKIEEQEQIRRNVDKFKLKSQERKELSESLKNQIDTNFQSDFQIKVEPRLAENEERDF